MINILAKLTKYRILSLGRIIKSNSLKAKYINKILIVLGKKLKALIANAPE